MWELFLSTYVQEKDFDQARAVLQGLCAMSAHPVWRRVLFFTSSPQNTGLPSVKRLPAAHPQRPWWLELDGHLRRTQFNFQVRYELGINGPTDFGDHFAQSADDLARGLRGPDLNALPGTLHWTDIPDTKQTNTLVTQRRVVEVQEQKGLMGILAESNCTFKREAVLVSFTYVRDGVQFVFERMYPVPASPLGQQDIGGAAPSPSPSSLLPPAASLEPLSPDIWQLTARCYVLEDDRPELVARAVEELMGVAAELQGVFKFRPIDRRRLDTRVPVSRELQPPPPLPQTQAVGR